jgi:hypothetical protein
LTFGNTLSEPRVGCIAVLEPLASGSSGHVGFFIKQDGSVIELLGGNQQDRVSIASFPATALRKGGFRWPTGVP